MRDEPRISSLLGPGARRLHRHETAVSAAPDAAYHALLSVTLADLPVTRLLFRLRRIAYARGMTLREFFTTPPFRLLDEEAPRGATFGVTALLGGAAPPTDAASFRVVPAGLKAAARFGVEPRDGGSAFVTETWAATSGVRAGALFRVYWLAVGPFSALIRRELLRAAKRRAERGG
jgi:hypothetical protein